MIHLESLICYSCQSNLGRNLFDQNERRAIVGTCGHSVCLSCSKLDPNQNCPICNHSNAFIHGTVNYEAMNHIEFFKENAFKTFRKWWETLSTGVGICSNCASQETLRICLSCQKAKNLKDVSILGRAMCELCADRMVEKGKTGNRTHQCDKVSMRDAMRGTEHVHCTQCGGETRNPQICTICFHWYSNHINLDTSAFCADCILDYHKNHDILKASEDYSVRHNTVDIMKDLLNVKLDNLTDSKCKLRKMRLDLTGQDLIYWASSHYALYTEDTCPGKTLIGRPILKEKVVERIINSLEKQFNQLESLEEQCHCVEVWKEVKRLNLFDGIGVPTHFQVMCLKPNSCEDVEGCPYDLESSEEWKDQLLELVGRGEVLTESLETIYVTPSES